MSKRLKRSGIRSFIQDLDSYRKSHNKDINDRFQKQREDILQEGVLNEELYKQYEKEVDDEMAEEKVNITRQMNEAYANILSRMRSNPYADPANEEKKRKIKRILLDEYNEKYNKKLKDKLDEFYYDTDGVYKVDSDLENMFSRKRLKNKKKKSIKRAKGTKSIYLELVF